MKINFEKLPVPHFYLRYEERIALQRLKSGLKELEKLYGRELTASEKGLLRDYKTAITRKNAGESFWALLLFGLFMAGLMLLGAVV